MSAIPKPDSSILLREDGVRFLSTNAYAVNVSLPSDVANGPFLVNTLVLKDGQVTLDARTADVTQAVAAGDALWVATTGGLTGETRSDPNHRWRLVLDRDGTVREDYEGRPPATGRYEVESESGAGGDPSRVDLSNMSGREAADRLFDGAGEDNDIKGRINEIRNEIEASTSDDDREKLQERLAKLSGGVAIIRVGGGSRHDLHGVRALDLNEGPDGAPAHTGRAVACGARAEEAGHPFPHRPGLPRRLPAPHRAAHACALDRRDA